MLFFSEFGSGEPLNSYSTFVIINAAVVVLRYREPNVHRPFKIPISLGKLPVIPLLGVVASLVMLLFVGWTAILAGTALATLGMMLYLLHRRRLHSKR